MPTSIVPCCLIKVNEGSGGVGKKSCEINSVPKWSAAHSTLDQCFLKISSLSVISNNIKAIRGTPQGVPQSTLLEAGPGAPRVVTDGLQRGHGTASGHDLTSQKQRITQPMCPSLTAEGIFVRVSEQTDLLAGARHEAFCQSPAMAAAHTNSHLPADRSQVIYIEESFGVIKSEVNPTYPGQLHSSDRILQPSRWRSAQSAEPLVSAPKGALLQSLSQEQQQPLQAFGMPPTHQVPVVLPAASQRGESDVKAADTFGPWTIRRGTAECARTCCCLLAFICRLARENMGEKDSLGFARQIQGISLQARAVNRNGSCGIREDCKNRNNYLRASGLGKGERPPASTYPRPLVFLKLQQGSITGLPCCSLAEHQTVILDTAEETVQSVITIASAAVAELCLFPVNHFLHYRHHRAPSFAADIHHGDVAPAVFEHLNVLLHDRSGQVFEEGGAENQQCRFQINCIPYRRLGSLAVPADGQTAQHSLQSAPKVLDKGWEVDVAGGCNGPGCVLPPEGSSLPITFQRLGDWTVRWTSQLIPWKRRKTSCQTRLLIQLCSSCTVAKSDARTVRDVQGAGMGRELFPIRQLLLVRHAAATSTCLRPARPAGQQQGDAPPTRAYSEELLLSLDAIS
ncbi:hypothetical protein Anapl_07586 [Anas platyrhynchos]|uniref:Uncharacterized protein n=1 Tax=Anas platyrhynchos TaxID=8839 RepID=R0M1X9_ANAPL|nr:hypothetical protein Anapl_07586 [Anas platyrhynchos]